MMSAMPKSAGESSFARFGSENRSLRLSWSSITSAEHDDEAAEHRAEHRRGAADHDRDEELDRDLERLDLAGVRRGR